jgi:hypothetical protein
MKLYAIVYYYKSDSMTDRPDCKVVAILTEKRKTEFFRNLNMFARDFYDYYECDLDDMSAVEHIMVRPPEKETE